MCRLAPELEFRRAAGGDAARSRALALPRPGGTGDRPTGTARRTEYVGVSGSAMDHMVSALGKPGQAMFLDTRDLSRVAAPAVRLRHGRGACRYLAAVE